MTIRKEYKMVGVSDLIVIYSFFLLFYISYFVYGYAKEKSINAIVIVRAMYIIIYCIVPLFSFIAISNSRSPDMVSKYLSLSEKGIHRLELVSVLSFLGFIALEIGNRTRIVIGHKKKSTTIKKAIDPSEKALWISAVIMLTISLIAFYFWAKPFGGLLGVLKYGTYIRSGYYIAGITNSYGFMKHFVPLAQFCSLICVALLINRFSFKYLLVSGFSIIESLFYLVANDGRAPFMMYFVSIIAMIYIQISRKKPQVKRSANKNFVFLIAISLIGLFIIENAEVLMGLTRNATNNTIKSNGISFDFLIKEFSFTIRNAQTVFEAKEAGVGLRIFKDLLSAVFSIIPSRFTPDGINRLEIINTYYFAAGQASYGGCPTDIIVTGIYELGIIGAIFLPFIYGMIIRKFDNYYKNNRNSMYSAIIYTQLMYQFVKTVAYADFALVVLNLFYIAIGHIIVSVISRLKLSVPKA